MSLSNRRIAIILHGPPCTGKTTIARELLQRLPGKLVSLDDGWFQGGFRRQPGITRYADLAGAPEQVLVVEVGCGEPPDLTFFGATRGADEWVDVLRNAGREVFPFRLVAEWDDVVRRLENRHAGEPNMLFSIWSFTGLYALYERGHAIATFPKIDGFEEQTISTSGRTLHAVADEIMAFADLA